MVVPIILLALGAVMSVVFIVSKVTNYSLKTIIFKTVASLFFVALGIYFVVVVQGHVVFKILVLLGLIFGLLGDVFLGFKYITTKTKKIWILLGLFAFALGHMCYLVSLFLEFYDHVSVWYAVLPFVTAIVITFLYMLVSTKLGIEFGRKLLPFALFYLFCLTSMVSTAFYMSLLHGFQNITAVVFFGGAVCFMASDFMLTGSYFKEGQRSKPYLAIYSVFYYLAQFAIAFSLFFLIA